MCILLIDIAQTYQRLNPLFGISGKDAPSTGSQGYLLRCLNIMSCLVRAPYGMLNILYHTVGIVSVTLHLTAPEDWPDVFGRFADAYTVRRYWG